MIPIIVCGNTSDRGDKLISVLCRSFKRYGSTLIYTKGSGKYNENNDTMKIYGKDLTPKFAIYELPFLPAISRARGLLIFKNSFISNASSVKLDGVTPIVDDQNKTAISMLKKTGSSVISCGMATHNTLSIASIDYNSAVVSLQRSIKTLNGDIVEPHDFALYFDKETDSFPLLASAAVLLLSNVDSSKGFYL